MKNWFEIFQKIKEFKYLGNKLFYLNNKTHIVYPDNLKIEINDLFIIIDYIDCKLKINKVAYRKNN